MPSSYPGALDAFTNPSAAGGDTLDDPPHDGQHADANDAIEAIETELGINPRGSEASVRARLDAIESAASRSIRRDRNSAQSIPHATSTVLDLNLENHAEADEYVTWDATNSRFDVVQDCFVDVTCGTEFAANTSGVRQLSVWINGTENKEIDQNAAASGSTGMSLPMGVFKATAGMTIQVRAFQNSTAALDVTRSYCSVLVVKGL